MFDLRLSLCIPSSLIHALARTIIASLVHFNSFPPSLQHSPAGIHSSFHGLKDLSEMKICVTPLLKIPSCLPKGLALEIKALSNLVLVYLSRFKCITSSVILSQVSHTLSPRNCTCHSLFLEHPFLLFLAICPSGLSFILIFSIIESFLSVSLPGPSLR